MTEFSEQELRLPIHVVAKRGQTSEYSTIKSVKDLKDGFSSYTAELDVLAISKPDASLADIAIFLGAVPIVNRGDLDKLEHFTVERY